MTGSTLGWRPYAAGDFVAECAPVMAAKSAALFLLFLAPWGLRAQEWRFYGGDAGGARFSSLQQINRQNVGTLKRAWTYHTGEVIRGNETDRHHIAPFETTPLVVDGVLYLTTPSNRVIALDAETGKELWQFDPQAGRADRTFFQHRGVAYWQSDAGDDRRILYGTFDGRLICLDAKTGKTCPGFGTNGRRLPRRAVRRHVASGDLQEPSHHGSCGSGISVERAKRRGTRI
jgi:quinoprotein glucose dehydrogenase